MSVDLRLLLRQVHTGSIHERTHLQEKSCCTVSGTGEPRTHSTARFLSSSVVLPQSVGLGTNGEGSKHLCPMVAWRDGFHKVEVDLRACSVGGFLQFFSRELFRYFLVQWRLPYTPCQTSIHSKGCRLPRASECSDSVTVCKGMHTKCTNQGITFTSPCMAELDHVKDPGLCSTFLVYTSRDFVEHRKAQWQQ